MTQETNSGARVCPTCGDDSLDDTVPGVEPICRSCGLVISEGTTIRTSESLDQNETEEAIIWSEYYNVRNSTEQQIASAFVELEEIGDRLSLGISELVRSAELYADAAVDLATDGRPAALVIAAVVVHATRFEKNPRPLGCVAGAANVDVKSLSRIVSSLPIEVGFETRSPAPSEYLHWLCSELETNSKLQERAIDIIGELASRGLVSGRHPVGIAAAAIYLAMDGSVTQRTIANTAGITEETIRARVADCRDIGIVK